MSTKHKVAALERAAAKKSPYPAYIRWEGHQISGVACKLCGNPISLRGQPTPAYREIEISFNDGSKHVTPLCATCRDRGVAAPALDAIYCDDMKALAIEEEHLGRTVMKWEMWADRTPVGYRSI